MAIFVLIFTAFSAQIAEARRLYELEKQDKRSSLDAKHAQLRKESAQLADDRARLTAIEKKKAEREDLKMRNRNLEALHKKLSADLKDRNIDPKSDIRVGAADAGLVIEPSALPSLAQQVDPTAPEYAYVLSLEHTPILQARVQAYAAQNERLERQVKALKEKRGQLEGQMRRIVSLSVPIDVEDVDVLVGRLVAVVESEREVDIRRARELLRQIEREGL